jgi:hypothetical protein
MEAISTRQLLDRFADAIDANGIAAVPADLLISFVDVARSVDASPVAVAVLVDPTEPDVVRERAFCKVSVQVVGRAGRIAPLTGSSLSRAIPQPV